MFDKGAPSVDSIVAALVKRHVPAAAAAVIAELIRNHTPQSPAEVLSALSASAWTDRLYSTVDLISFAKPFTYGSLQARVVAGVALASDSAAASGSTETTSPGALAAAARLRSAELLTAVREGGPVALNIAYQYEFTPPSATIGFGAAVAGSIAQSGKTPIQSSDGYTAGVTGELKGFLRTSNLAHPSSLLLTVRGGYRHSPNGILSGLDEKKLTFAQATIEFRARRVAVPLGLVVSWANDKFRPYLRTVQFFGIAAL